eukprot:363599-Chlamydomonas_euryale.AAC.2
MNKPLFQLPWRKALPSRYSCFCMCVARTMTHPGDRPRLQREREMPVALHKCCVAIAAAHEISCNSVCCTPPASTARYAGARQVRQGTQVPGKCPASKARYAGARQVRQGTQVLTMRLHCVAHMHTVQREWCASGVRFVMVRKRGCAQPPPAPPAAYQQVWCGDQRLQSPAPALVTGHILLP